METTLNTRDKLLLQARRQFWAHGYSNVSVRQISAGAGVDVALISRYFGSKLGLFQATLDGAFSVGDPLPEDAIAMVEGFVTLFLTGPRGGIEPSPMLMLLTNVHDEVVGDIVRNLFQTEFYDHIVGIIGSHQRAAMFVAVLLGVSMAEKTLHLSGVRDRGAPKYEAQLRHLMQAALGFASDDDV